MSQSVLIIGPHHFNININTVIASIDLLLVFIELESRSLKYLH